MVGKKAEGKKAEWKNKRGEKWPKEKIADGKKPKEIFFENKII